MPSNLQGFLKPELAAIRTSQEKKSLRKSALNQQTRRSAADFSEISAIADSEPPVPFSPSRWNPAGHYQLSSFAYTLWALETKALKGAPGKKTKNTSPSLMPAAGLLPSSWLQVRPTSKVSQRRLLSVEAASHQTTDSNGGFCFVPMMTLGLVLILTPEPPSLYLWMILWLDFTS